MPERRHLREILGNARIVAWVCPVESHSDRQPGAPMRVTVDWDGDVAHCTTPGCFRTSQPKRIQRQRTKGWRMPPGALYVGRPTVYGNPWTIEDASHLMPGVDWRAWVVARYERDLVGRGGTGELEFVTVEQIRERLAGKDLACWCPIDAACHADVLLRVANEPPGSTRH